MSDRKDRSKLNGDIVTIDFNVWCTQAQLAEATGTKLTTISTKVKRTLDGTAPVASRVEYLRIEQLNITLVKRP